MKTSLGILLGVVFVIVVIVVGAIIILNSLGNTMSGQPPSAVISPTSPTRTTATPAPTTSQPVPTPTVVPGSVPTSATVGIFDMAIKAVKMTGATSADVTVQITNTSNSDANNTSVKIEVSSQGQIIKINGQDFIQEDLGSVKAKTTIIRTRNISLSLTDALKVTQGADVTISVSSDQGSAKQTIPFRPTG